MIKILSDQSDWDELLGFISEKNLTPVIGKEMYKFREEDKLIPIDEYLSNKLLEVNKVTDQPSLTLPEAVNYLENEKRVKPLDIKNKLKAIVKDIVDKDFPGLTDFLSISELNYYINTAVYNNVLEDNFTKVRGLTADSINFSINQPFSDSGDLEKLSEPFVFNVFGSLLNTVDPALSEEDMLEYTGTFKEKMNIAPNIINALKNKNLLFLGCAFPDWMVRFILRLLSNEPMHDWGNNRKIFLVNDKTDLRQRQFNFLKNYDVVTYDGNTIDFATDITGRWTQQNPQKKESKLIFLSYTREDQQAVESLKRSLESIENITCWYDNQNLRGGDIFNTEIQYNIRKADLFIPLISARSLTHEGYIRDEWKSASNEEAIRRRINGNTTYLFPVVIDESELYGQNIPDFFKDLNILKALNGNPDEKFLNDIKATLKLI